MRDPLLDLPDPLLDSVDRLVKALALQMSPKAAQYVNGTDANLRIQLVNDAGDEKAGLDVLAPDD